MEQPFVSDTLAARWLDFFGVADRIPWQIHIGLPGTRLCVISIPFSWPRIVLGIWPSRRS